LIWASAFTATTYRGLVGDIEFVELLGGLVFGDVGTEADRIAGIQTPGGSAALRLAGDIMKRFGPDIKIWVGLPCWANHLPIFEAAGLNIETYNYYDTQSRSVDRASMYSNLETAGAGDIILLQGCCHNPTGADLSLEDWKWITGLCNDKGVVPLIDIAYQGLGRGLTEDMAGVRHLTRSVPEALVSVSCSKNFGLYRERTGALYVFGANPQKADLARSNLFSLARTSYSMPPDHGAAVVISILQNAEFRKVWETELEGMRTRIFANRQAFVQAWDNNIIDLSYVLGDQGMFSLLPLKPAQIDVLRAKHAIYLPGNGRINLAGLAAKDIPMFVEGLRSVLK